MLNDFQILNHSNQLDWNNSLVLNKNNITTLEIPIDLADNLETAHTVDTTIVSTNRLFILKDSPEN